jgi:hypothetical protein
MLDMRDAWDQGLGVLLDKVLSQNIEIFVRPGHLSSEGEGVYSHEKLRFSLDEPYGDPVDRLLDIGYFADDCVLLREHGALEDLSRATLYLLLLLT